MAYCQVSDVVALAPGVELNNTSKPSAGAVTSFISELEQELNAQLTRLGYTAPVVQATSPLAFKVIKNKLAHAALAHVLRARAYGATSPKDQGADVAQRVYDAWINALMDPKLPTELPDDAVRTSEVVEKVSAEQTRSHVSGLPSAQFDVNAPPVTMRDVF